MLACSGAARVHVVPQYQFDSCAVASGICSYIRHVLDVPKLAGACESAICDPVRGEARQADGGHPKCQQKANGRFHKLGRSARKPVDRVLLLVIKRHRAGHHLGLLAHSYIVSYVLELWCEHTNNNNNNNNNNCTVH